MEPLIVVTYPEPVALEARPIEHEAIPDGNVGIGYYYHDSLIARSVVTPESVDAIHSILSEPVSVALAATVDTQGNIDGRVCLVLPVHGEEEGEEDAEPWRASVPTPPAEVEDGYGEESDPAVGPRAVLLPIGNVVRSARDRNHPNDAADDAREMLDNLLAGQAQDAIAKAIDDLLRSV
jgi:hypothetical protein